jgi:hypothetical protein
MRVSWAVRVLRAAVFAVMCVTLSAAAHRLAMGAAPPMWVEGWGLLGVLGLVCPLCGRERSLSGIAGVMIAIQVVLHVAFDAAQAHQAAMSMPSMPMSGQHDAHTMTARAAVAHLLAALAASWWLHRGEAAFWSLLRRRAGTLVPALAAWWSAQRIPVLRVPAQVRSWPRPWSVQQPLLRHALSRRGPPEVAPPRVLCA